jgi:hypothetical protein
MKIGQIPPSQIVPFVLEELAYAIIPGDRALTKKSSLVFIKITQVLA